MALILPQLARARRYVALTLTGAHWIRLNTWSEWGREEYSFLACRDETSTAIKVPVNIGRRRRLPDHPSHPPRNVMSAIADTDSSSLRDSVPGIDEGAVEDGLATLWNVG
jgi:hypothetical protein